MERWIRARYQPNLPLDGNNRATACPEHIALSRQAAREGMVLLKNDNDLLPLARGSRVAIFGKGSFDYVKGAAAAAMSPCPMFTISMRSQGGRRVSL